jgi:hypothetical protein
MQRLTNLGSGYGSYCSRPEWKCIHIHVFFKKLLVDPNVAEANATWKAVKFNRDLDMMNIMLEGDAMKIVNVIRMEGKSCSRYSHLIEDVSLVPILGCKAC